MNTVPEGVLKPVKSSNVLAMGYHAETSSFFVHWRAGRISHYADVPQDAAEKALAHPSPGKAVRTLLLPTYRHRYLPEGKADA